MTTQPFPGAAPNGGSDPDAAAEAGTNANPEPGTDPGAGRDPGNIHAHATEGPAQLHRARGGRLIGGVAAGVATWLDLDVTIVRIGAVLLTLFGGVGVPLYVAAWLIVPEEGTEECLLADLLSTGSAAHPA